MTIYFLILERIYEVASTGKFLLTFYLFFIHLLLLYHISPGSLILSNWLPWPSRTASSSFSYKLGKKPGKLAPSCFEIRLGIHTEWIVEESPTGCATRFQLASGEAKGGSWGRAGHFVSY